jgi:predicted RNase H-like nuclease (RuvC/YqgF family)
MFFRKKSAQESKADLDEIKQVMAEPIGESIEEPVRYKERETAPLFVKVDKYKHVINTVQEMKSFVSGIKQLFVVMHEIEDIRAETLNMMKATVQRLEKNIAEVDSELLMPKGLEIEFEREETEINRVESSLLELQKQLSSLKQELQEFK